MFNFEEKDNCGHSDEKHKKLDGMLNNMLAQFADELIGKDDIKRVTDLLRNLLKTNGIPFNKTTLTAFKSGLMMGMSTAHRNDGQMAMMVSAVITKILNDMTKDINEKVNKSLKSYKNKT